jgi:hypothetical protein
MAKSRMSRPVNTADASAQDRREQKNGMIPNDGNRRDQKVPLTLHPLSFEDAVRGALSTGRMPKERKSGVPKK